MRHIYQNLPNSVSFLGVLPLCILLQENAFLYLCPLILFNNFMDDLDGMLAKKLQLCGAFGARLDNVCDAVAHVLIALVVGSHYGGIVLASALLSALVIIIRVVQRLAPSFAAGTGTPTNELMRHIFLLTILQEPSGFNFTPCLVAAYILNSVSMLAPFAMPHLIRSKVKSATGILCVNAVLALAWYLPITAPFIAAAFFGSYLYSFVAGGVRWLAARWPRSSGHPEL